MSDMLATLLEIREEVERLIEAEEDPIVMQRDNPLGLSGVLLVTFPDTTLPKGSRVDVLGMARWPEEADTTDMLATALLDSDDFASRVEVHFTNDEPIVYEEDDGEDVEEGEEKTWN